MANYMWVEIPTADVDESFDLPGRAVTVSKRREEPFTQVTVALVEVGSDEPVRTIEDPTCAEFKSDGSPCTRTVDEVGDLCWQHEDDDG